MAIGMAIHLRRLYWCSFRHTVKLTHLFQNTARRLPKFPRTHRDDVLPFVVVAEKHCVQILATVRALLYDDGDAKFMLGHVQAISRLDF